jgi:hypothetical protein
MGGHPRLRTEHAAKASCSSCGSRAKAEHGLVVDARFHLGDRQHRMTVASQSIDDFLINVLIGEERQPRPRRSDTPLRTKRFGGKGESRPNSDFGQTGVSSEDLRDRFHQRRACREPARQ